MKNTWLGLAATLAAAVLLTPAAWAAHGHGGGGGHGYAGHGYAGHAYHGGHGYYGHGGYGYGDWDRYRGWGYPGFYGNGWGAYVGVYPSYNYYYYGSYPDYSSYDYGPDYYSYAPSVSPYQSFYPPESYDATAAPAAPAAPAATDEAVVNVRVPDPNAKVWFQGALTRQTGTERSYSSPPLDPNGSYTYDVRAEWNDNGRVVDQTRHVRVHAGDRVTVDFLAPMTTETR